MHFTSYTAYMTFAWTPHRFSGGALALDVANSVILRSDPARRADRLEVTEQMQAFSAAAAEFSAERALFGEIKPVAEPNRNDFLALREAIDAYFRRRVEGHDDRVLLANLLQACARMLKQSASEATLEAATARSALRLLAETDRLKVCGNCGWLFVDRSRNRSRTWCDMAVCGNRVKANRHYRRKKEAMP